jgi:uncharacterized protein with von Willebrand factor type A (vWA) domain
MSEIAKPLYLLFTRLRLAELPLGLDDYALLLQALAAGRGETREELARLCRALWVRTADPALLRLFQADFERIMPRDYGRSATPTTKQPEKPATDSPKEEGDKSPANQPPKPKQEETKSQKEPIEKSEKPKQEEVKASQFQTGRNLDELGNRQIGFEVSQGIDVTTQAFYSFSSDYLPITARQMKQNWRYLRRAARFGPPVDLDVAATVQKIAHEGMMPMAL